MRLVYPRVHQKPSILLVEAIKNGKPDLKIDPPLIVYQENGAWTDEVASIYNNGSESDGKTL
jgi:tRNA1(Val) A37 N6-methylase TrmN6